MANTDLKKQTFNWTMREDGSTVAPTFTSTDQARGIIFTDAATTYHNDTANFIQIQWALADDKNLRCTVLYGNENATPKEWKDGIATLEAANNYYKTDYDFSCSKEATPHLF